MLFCEYGRLVVVHVVRQEWTVRSSPRPQQLYLLVPYSSTDPARHLLNETFMSEQGDNPSLL